MAGANGTTAAFEQAYQQARALLAQVARDEMRTRHKLGALLRTMKYGAQTYGERAIERLAERLEVSADVLYRCAAVAEHWTAEEVEQLGTRTNRRGEPLSWSHLVALTRVSSTPTRRKMADRAIEGSWSVRELTDQIAAASPSGSRDSETERTGASVRLALREGVQNASRAAMQLSVFLEALEDRLEEASEEDEALFATAIGAYEGLHVKVEAALSRLREAKMSSFRRLRAAPPVAGGGKAGRSSR